MRTRPALVRDYGATQEFWLTEDIIVVGIYLKNNLSFVEAYIGWKLFDCFEISWAA